MKLTRLFASAIALGAAIAVVTPAAAEDFKPKAAKTIVLRARTLGVIPDESGKIETAGGVDTGLRVNGIGNDVIPELDLTYFFTDNIAIEAIAGTNGHSVKASGVDLGNVRMLPPTITLQYHFFPKERVSPYIGAGVNYTFMFTTSTGAMTSVEYDNSFGAALQAGVDIALSGPWSLNLDVKKVFMSTDVKVNGGALKSNVDLDPWLVGVGVGYRF
jgi:outer membrane protein